MSEDEVSPGGIGGPFAPGTASVSPEVMRWEPLVRKYAAQYGIEAMTPLILALIQQESSGTQLDVMQSSESQGHPPGYFTDPEESIKYGLMHFADCHKNPMVIKILHYNVITMELAMLTMQFRKVDILTRMQGHFLQSNQLKMGINVVRGEVQRL